MVFNERTFHGEKPVIDALHPTKAERESALASALAAAGGIDATDIEVIAADDGMHLRGVVTTREEVDKCLFLAEQMGLRVVNELTVINIVPDP